MKRLLCMALLFGANLAHAAGWTFAPEISVTGAAQQNVFHHLDAAGRNSIAASRTHVAVIWEDRSSGTEQIYLALKPLQGDKFSAPRKLSDGQTAYEPVLADVGGGQFLAAWEQDGRIVARVCSEQGMGPLLRIGGESAGQVSITAAGRGVALLAWAQQEGAYHRILWAHVTANKSTLSVSSVRAVEAQPPRGEQAYPAIVKSGRGMVVAWEDARHKANRLLVAHSADGRRFSEPQELNEIIRKSEVFGEASTVTRVALAAPSAREVLAVWLDKRDVRVGYKVFSASSRDGGRHFGVNERVQDGFGDNVPQWHAGIAAQGRQTVIAWDDAREETPGIWMAWRQGQSWSDNVLVSSPAPQAEQTSPSLVLDAAGKLHVVWVWRQGEASRISYRMGQFQP